MHLSLPISLLYDFVSATTKFEKGFALIDNEDIIIPMQIAEVSHPYLFDERCKNKWKKLIRSTIFILVDCILFVFGALQCRTFGIFLTSCIKERSMLFMYSTKCSFNYLVSSSPIAT